MTSEKCGHGPCGCEIDGAGSKYCSSYCEQQSRFEQPGEESMHGCGCGHSDCEAGAEGITDEELEQTA